MLVFLKFFLVVLEWSFQFSPGFPALLFQEHFHFKHIEFIFNAIFWEVYVNEIYHLTVISEVVWAHSLNIVLFSVSLILPITSWVGF